MRRVLVPLDGTSLAASILPDAKQLAGADGELILIRDPNDMVSGRMELNQGEEQAVEDALASLETQAERLRVDGVKVETRALVAVDAADAIDIAARIYHADMVACATHGRGPLGRVRRGGVVWRSLADSPVPVLVRHFEASNGYQATTAPEPRILVPLDGSESAERALPLAQELMAEWNASLWLAHVVSSYPITGLPHSDIDPEAITDERAGRAALHYLDDLAGRLTGKINQHVLFGPVSEHLIAAVGAWDITHVVMTSHGRTGLARVLLGSVADDLIQQLACPIIVIPLHASNGSAHSVETVTTAHA